MQAFSYFVIKYRSFSSLTPVKFGSNIAFKFFQNDFCWFHINTYNIRYIYDLENRLQVLKLHWKILLSSKGAENSTGPH